MQDEHKQKLEKQESRMGMRSMSLTQTMRDREKTKHLKTAGEVMREIF